MTIKLKHPAKFANTFVDACLQQGFQSLSKRDIELLFFMLLEQDGAISHQQDNFEIARQLRLTPDRIKELRRNAYARWRSLLAESSDPAMERILKAALTAENIQKGIDHASEKTRKDGFLAIRVEHPDDREQFEYALLKSGGLPVYERNREVLAVRFDTLLTLAEKYGLCGQDYRGMRDRLSRLRPAEENLGELLSTDIKDLKWADIRTAINQLGSSFVVNEAREGLGKQLARLFNVVLHA